MCAGTHTVARRFFPMITPLRPSRSDAPPTAPPRTRSGGSDSRTSMATSSSGILEGKDVGRGCPTPRTTASRGKKRKLDVLAAMAGCARQDALAEQLCRHAEAGNADGVREVLAEGADVDKGIFTDTYSKPELREITPLMLACRKDHMAVRAGASRGGC